LVPVNSASTLHHRIKVLKIAFRFRRFGFNVKGGIDQKLPIIVSRVGANTPADRQVLLRMPTDRMT
jgi:hypothetical protein